MMGYGLWGVRCEVAIDIEIDSELFTPYRITNYEWMTCDTHYKN